MIQRIQTVYLLIASILIFLIFLFPIADLVAASESFSFWYRGLYGILLDKEVMMEQSSPLAIIYLLLLMLSLSSIFLYKLRQVQMKLCIANIILTLLCVLLTFVYIFIIFSDYQAKVQFKIYSAFPLLVVFFFYLAYRGIKKDEELVKSIDRIR